jgi:hypothetical protein
MKEVHRSSSTAPHALDAVADAGEVTLRPQ